MSPEQIHDYRNQRDDAYFELANGGISSDTLDNVLSIANHLIDYTEHREAQRAKAAKRLRALRTKTTSRCSGSARS